MPSISKIKLKRKLVGPSVGVDLGGTKIRVGVVYPDGTLVKAIQEQSDSRHATALVDQICRMVEDTADGHSISSIGIASPGWVDSEAGLVRYAHNLPFHNTDLVSPVKKCLDAPVLVEHDGRCAAIAEYVQGAGQGAKQLLFLGLGTGIACSVISNGEVMRGSTGAAGHIAERLFNAEHPYLTRSVCSGRGLCELAAQKIMTDRTGEFAEKIGTELKTAIPICDLAEQGDETAQWIVEQAIRGFAAGVVTLAAFVNPDVIVVGGGLGLAMGDQLVPAAVAELENYHLPMVREIPVKLARHGTDAGVLGAALAAARKFGISKPLESS